MPTPAQQRVLEAGRRYLAMQVWDDVMGEVAAKRDRHFDRLVSRKANGWGPLLAPCEVHYLRSRVLRRTTRLHHHAGEPDYPQIARARGWIRVQLSWSELHEVKAVGDVVATELGLSDQGLAGWPQSEFREARGRLQAAMIDLAVDLHDVLSSAGETVAYDRPSMLWGYEALARALEPRLPTGRFPLPPPLGGIPW